MSCRKEEDSGCSDDPETQNPDESASTKKKTKRRAGLPVGRSDNPYRKEYKTRRVGPNKRTSGRTASATSAESVSAANPMTSEAEGALKTRSPSTNSSMDEWIRRLSTGASSSSPESSPQLRKGALEEGETSVSKVAGRTSTARLKLKSKVSTARRKSNSSVSSTRKRQPGITSASQRPPRKFHEGVPANLIEERKMIDDFKRFLQSEFQPAMWAAQERKSAAFASEGFDNNLGMYSWPKKASGDPSWKLSRDSKDQQGQNVGLLGLDSSGFWIYNEDLDVLSNEDYEVPLFPMIYNDEVYVAVPRTSGGVMLVPGCVPWLESGLLNGKFDVCLLNQGMPSDQFDSNWDTSNNFPAERSWDFSDSRGNVGINSTGSMTVDFVQPSDGEILQDEELDEINKCIEERMRLVELIETVQPDNRPANESEVEAKNMEELMRFVEFIESNEDISADSNVNLESMIFGFDQPNEGADVIGMEEEDIEIVAPKEIEHSPNVEPLESEVGIGPVGNEDKGIPSSCVQFHDPALSDLGAQVVTISDTETESPPEYELPLSMTDESPNDAVKVFETEVDIDNEIPEQMELVQFGDRASLNSTVGDEPSPNVKVSGAESTIGAIINEDEEASLPCHELVRNRIFRPWLEDQEVPSSAGAANNGEDVANADDTDEPIVYDLTSSSSDEEVKIVGYHDPVDRENTVAVKGHMLWESDEDSR